MPIPPALPRRAAAALLALGLLAGTTACSSDDDGAGSPRSTTTAPGRPSTPESDDDGSPDRSDEAVADATEADYVDALATNFGRAGGVFGEEGVRCLAGGWMDVIGADTFRDAGIPPDDLARNQARFEDLEIDRSTAEALADSFDACGLQLRDAYLRTLEGDLSEQGKACVDDLLTEDAVRRSFVADLIGEELDPDPLTQVERCTR